jgi:hypothetical protein
MNGVLMFCVCYQTLLCSFVLTSQQPALWPFFPEHEFWKKGKLQPMLAFFLLIWVFGPNRLKP